MDSALKYVLSNISPSGKKVTVVPVSPFLQVPITSNWATALPFSYICWYTLPSERTLTSNHTESALTTEAPTP